MLLRQHGHSDIGTPCKCDGIKKCNTMCFECIQAAPSCEDCFIQQHRRSPLHWAHVWDFTLGFFIKKDISTLSTPFSLHLNHGSDACTHPLGSVDTKFIIVASNGVHATLLRFCDCLSALPKIQQLCNAGLFPATTRAPVSAFTFELLKKYHVHTLQSKVSAYDFIGAIQRITDNVFTNRVLVSCHRRLSSFGSQLKTSGFIQTIPTSHTGMAIPHGS